MTDIVTLREVFLWDCPGCKHQNISYGEGIPPEDLVEEIRKEFDDPDLTAAEFREYPCEVTCGQCLQTYDTDTSKFEKDDD